MTAFLKPSASVFVLGEQDQPALLSSALTWLRRQPGNGPLWVDSGLGARLARWLESVTASDTALRAATHPLRAQMDDLLARLVQVGVAEAHRVERLLAEAMG